MAIEVTVLPDTQGAIERLLEILGRSDATLRQQGVYEAACLLRCRPEQAETLEARLLELGDDLNCAVRAEVAAALLHVTGSAADTLLEALSADPVRAVAHAAKRSLKERRRLQRLEAQRGKRVAQITRRIQRLGERCSFDVSKEIEEVGLAYHQEIAMGCSHDVFNLAKSVRFSLRELRKELARRKVPRKVWEGVLEQGVRRLEVTEGIALSMRSLAKQCIPAVRRITLQRAVDEALGVVRDRFRERGHEARVETIVRVPKHLRVEVPRDRLLQALINLLQNAFEAIKDAGVVWIEGQLVDDRVELTLADTGRGIREELQQVVFFPGKSTKKGRRGHEHNTGWGLSLARKFVEQDCRGELSLTSEFGKGTTITLRLPLRRPEVEA